MLDRSTSIAAVKEYGIYVLLFIVYIIVGGIGLNIQPVATFSTLVWPPSAVALCALILGGYRLWPAILVAAFTLNLSIGAGIFASTGIAIGNTLEAVVGTYILTTLFQLDTSFARVRDNIGIICTAFFAPLISATLGVASVWLSNNIAHQNLAPSFFAWWGGAALSILVLTPLLLKWGSAPFFTRTRRQYVEFAISNAVVFATALVIFWSPNSEFAYYLFIPLTWVAFRTGPRGTTLAIGISTITALTGTLLGLGPYGALGLFPLGIFIATISALFLVFSSLVEERKHSAQTLTRHVTQLEEALKKISTEDEAKKNFLAILAHELRNPLASILSSIEVLQLSGTSASESAALLRRVQTHVNTMRTMLDDVLDMTRISRNKLALQKEPVPLDACIDHSVASVEPLMRSRDHTLVVTHSSVPLFVEGDAVRIEQILINLLTNAAKYTNPHGQIEVSVRKEAGMAAVSVHDNGIGIPRGMEKRIFEPFFQVKRGTLATEGLGVGLPLTHQLTEMHGGTIEAVSEGEGLGSEFIVRLPLATAEQIPASASKHIQKPRTAAQKHRLRAVKNFRAILVVDDNETAATSLARLLELRGHQVSIAYNGLDAIEKARKQRPDIVILDIGLPDIDGYEVARTLRSDPSFPSSLIALTGYGQEDDKKRAFEAGFEVHLTKPVAFKELEKAFKKVSTS